MRRESISVRSNRTRSGRYINRRRRQAIFRRISTIAVIIISTLLLIIASKTVSHAQSSDEIHYYKYYTSVTVMPGDTLYSIALDHSDNYDSIDEHITEMRMTNHLTSDEIYAGSSLIVPYYSTEYLR